MWMVLVGTYCIWKSRKVQGTEYSYRTRQNGSGIKAVTAVCMRSGSCNTNVADSCMVCREGAVVFCGEPRSSLMTSAESLIR
jgi:hypothetical protein